MLVILAILAAIAVPAVLGYVDESKRHAILKKLILFIQLFKQRKQGIKL